MGLLSVEGVVAGYSAADEVLKGVDLELAAGEIVSAISPNGRGQVDATQGHRRRARAESRGAVRLDDAAIQGRAPREISALGVAFVPQERNVFPYPERAREPRDGRLPRGRGARAERIEGIFGALPLLAERRRHAARTPVGRPASDPGHGDGADGGAAGAAAR